MLRTCWQVQGELQIKERKKMQITLQGNEPASKNLT